MSEDDNLRELLKNVMIAEEYLKKAGQIMAKIGNPPPLTDKANEAFIASINNIAYHTKGLQSFMGLSILQQFVSPKEETKSKN